MKSQTKIIAVKQINIGMVMALMSLAFLFVMALEVHTAKAAGPGPCYPISKTGVGIPVNGIQNSGVVSFEPAGGLPDDTMRACAYDPDDDGKGPFVLTGWVWNSNLGWISFSCKNGLNQGAACGAINYDGKDTNPAEGGVWITDGGKFHGYAWGDNVGWISFDNGLNSQLEVEINNAKCQGYVYSSVAPKDPFVTALGSNCPDHKVGAFTGKRMTNVWADSVGWIDLDGILVPWYTLTKSIKMVNVTLTPDPRDSLNPEEVGAVVADGASDYSLKATILDRDNQPVLSEPLDRYIVSIVPKWTEDTVKKDQISTIDILTGPNPCSADSKRAVDKPCYPDLNNITTGPAPFSFVSPDYVYPITSIAPTSNENQSKKKSDGKWVSNEKFFIPFSKQSEVREPNNLLLDSVSIRVWDREADQCAYADNWIQCTAKVTPINNNPAPVDFRFKPATTFTISNPDSGAGDYLTATAGNTRSINMQRNGPGQIKLYSGIDPEVDPSGDYKFGFTETQDTSSEADMLAQNPLPNFLGTPPGKQLWALLVNLKGMAAQYISGLYVYSEINELNGVKYYGGKLPRVVGSFGVSPVAVTTGNVYATCMSQTTKTTGDVRSLGDISSNKLRDVFAKNVASLIAGLKNPGGSGEVLIQNSTLLNCQSAGAMVCASKGNVIYVKGNAVLHDESDLIDWKGSKTIVVIGGYLKIESNILPSATTSKPRLGIIVMKDYTGGTTNPYPNMVGNVYVASNVSDIQANIVAPDGALLSYNPDVSHGINNVGLPKFTDIDDMETSLKTNQLWITGSVASNNTIGGATASNASGNLMYNGLCQKETDSLMARRFDLNYFRQYTGELRRDPSGIPTQENGNSATGELTEAQLIDLATGRPKPASEGGWLYPPADGVPSKQNPDKPGNLGSTYLVFDPPPSTLPGFAGENIFAVVIRPQ